MRDGFIFYRSFYEAISDLDNEQQLEIYQAIAKYSLNFEEPILSGVTATIFKLIKPQLEANNKRYTNGKQAKRKQNRSKTEAKPEQNGSKTEAKPEQNGSKTEAKPEQNESKAAAKEKEKEKEKEERKIEEKKITYSERFLRIWDYYQINGQKGDKASAYKAYTKSKIEDKTSEEIKTVLDYEMAKTYGQRHLSTLLNHFEATLEATKETSPADERTGYEY